MTMQAHPEGQPVALPDEIDGGSAATNAAPPPNPPTEAPAPKKERVPSPFALLFAPDRGMERQARIGRTIYLLGFAWLSSILLGVALAMRVDAQSSTLRKLEMSGGLQSMSDRQLADEIHSAERISQVASIAKGAL